MGCDCSAFNTRFEFSVSIHAPAWGATIPTLTTVESYPVSIHAPAWGATKHAVHDTSCSNVSIHAPAWGATIINCNRIFGDRFQSTHPHGVRLLASNVIWHFALFQSTHPHGVRPCIASNTCRLRIVSIHAPAWGATPSIVRYVPSRDVSIHAPAWGATIHNYSNFGKTLVSIHAPAWGATRRIPEAKPLG